MPNPDGFSVTTDPVQGLVASGHQIGLVENGLGSGFDGRILAEALGGYYYTRPFGLFVDGGPDCSPTPMNAVDSTGGLHPYFPQPMNGAYSNTYTSTTAASVATDAAGIAEFCTIELSFQPAIFDGTLYCEPTVSDTAFVVYEVDMAGFGKLDALQAGPHSVADMPPTGAGTIEFGFPVLLRPTAATWEGQDPDNIYNRAYWRTSEVAALTWKMNGYFEGIDFQVAYFLDGYNVFTGYPTPCPVTIRTPSTAAAGPGNPGLIKARNPPLGTTGGIQVTSYFTIVDLVHLARYVGLSGNSAATAAAIAMAESGGNPDAVGTNTDGSEDRGLWQINNFAHPDVSDTCAFAPVCNANAMVGISSGGTSWTPWTTYNTGAYLQFLAQAEAVP